MVKGKMFKKCLICLRILNSDDDVDISSEVNSDEDDNILDSVAAEQQNPQQEMSPPEDEQCNVYLCSPHHEGVTHISPIIDATIQLSKQAYQRNHLGQIILISVEIIVDSHLPEDVVIP